VVGGGGSFMAAGSQTRLAVGPEKWRGTISYCLKQHPNGLGLVDASLIGAVGILAERLLRFGALPM